MGIMEKRISAWFTDYCVEPIDGLGMYAVTKDCKVEQEQQHIYYDFYLMTAPMFKPLMGYTQVGDQQLPTLPHVNVLQALHLENSIENVGMLRLIVEDNFFSKFPVLQSAYMYSTFDNKMCMKIIHIRQYTQRCMKSFPNR